MCTNILTRSLRRYAVSIATMLLVTSYSTELSWADDSIAPPPEKGTAEWVLKMFFEEPSFPEFAEFVTGDESDHLLSQPPLGEIKSPDVSVSYRLLESRSDRRVYAVEYSDVSSDSDFYCYMSLDDGTWKMSALRGLALTGIYWALVQQCEEDASFADTSVVHCGNARLMISSDKQLKQHLIDNLDEFEEIGRMRRKTPVREKIVQDSTGKWVTRPPDAEDLREKELLDDLFLSEVMGVGENGEIHILVGGILENMLLYMYVPDGVEPPEMSPNDCIYVERIVPNWYLVKET